MNQIELIAEKIATRLKTREAAMASNVVSIDNVGNARKTSLEEAQAGHVSAVESDYDTKQGQYEDIITAGDDAWASKINIVKNVSAADAYRSLDELKTEMDEMKVEVIAKAAAVQTAVDAALDAEKAVWGSVAEMDSEFDGLDTDAPFSGGAA
tara:strand:- start:508 stop:966 length:459 start_codon:yes stop_codon:yes gene_type:complete